MAGGSLFLQLGERRPRADAQVAAPALMHRVDATRSLLQCRFLLAILPARTSGPLQDCKGEGSWRLAPSVAPVWLRSPAESLISTGFGSLELWRPCRGSSSFRCA